MPLFNMTEPEKEDGRSKRGRSHTGAIPRGREPDLETRVMAMEELTASMGHLMVAHDIRIRELGTAFRVLLIPKGCTFALNFERVDAKWKQDTADYYKRREENGESEQIGSKHLRIAATLLEGVYGDAQTKDKIKETLKARWEGKDTTNVTFLEGDIKIAKWRMGKDGKNGILEFKLTETLMEVEEEIIRVLIHHGATLKTGPGPRGDRIRDLERRLDHNGSRGSGIRR